MSDKKPEYMELETNPITKEPIYAHNIAFACVIAIFLPERPPIAIEETGHFIPLDMAIEKNPMEYISNGKPVIPKEYADVMVKYKEVLHKFSFQEFIEKLGLERGA